MSLDLALPSDRKKYFQKKVGEELKYLNGYLRSNSFILYFLAKKQAGKGTYATLLREILGDDKISHISTGDIIREAQEDIKKDEKKKNLEEWLESDYSGGFRIDDLVEMLTNHEFSKYFPTGLIVSLLKRAIRDCKGKALIVDGYPRTIEQIENSLKFTELVEYRADPDFFVHINCPEKVILERYKGRRTCPKCGNSRHIYLYVTENVCFNEKTGEVELICDNPKCGKQPLISKEGDMYGINRIQKRNTDTQELMEEIKKYTDDKTIEIYNSVPVEEFKGDDYEITKKTSFLKNNDGKIEKKNEKWIIEDDNGVKSYSYYPSPVVADLIVKIVEKLRK